jgi:hypothetical protein
VTRPRRIRLFLDSNVLTGGIVSPWGLDKAVLSLCAAGIGRLVLAEVVREEVEENLLLHAGRLSPADADQLIEDYHRLITLCGPERVRYPDADRVRANRALIRHAADPASRWKSRKAGERALRYIFSCVRRHATRPPAASG